MDRFYFLGGYFFCNVISLEVRVVILIYYLEFLFFRAWDQFLQLLLYSKITIEFAE